MAQAPVPGHQPAAGDAGLDVGVDGAAALIERQRVGLAGRAEDGKPGGAFIEQRLAVLDELPEVDAAVGGEGRRHRRPEAGQRLRGASRQSLLTS